MGFYDVGSLCVFHGVHSSPADFFPFPSLSLTPSFRVLVSPVSTNVHTLLSLRTRLRYSPSVHNTIFSLPLPPVNVFSPHCVPSPVSRSLVFCFRLQRDEPCVPVARSSLFVREMQHNQEHQYGEEDDNDCERGYKGYHTTFATCKDVYRVTLHARYSRFSSLSLSLSHFSSSGCLLFL